MENTKPNLLSKLFKKKSAPLYNFGPYDLYLDDILVHLDSTIHVLTHPIAPPPPRPGRAVGDSRFAELEAGYQGLRIYREYRIKEIQKKINTIIEICKKKKKGKNGQK